MRIGHVSFGYKPIVGGQETYLANLIRVLENDGHSQRVYQLDTGVRDPEIRPVPQLPPRLRYRASVLYAYNALLFRWLRQLVREDLLIVHYGFHYPPVFWHPRIIVVSHGVEWEIPPRSLHHKVRRWASKLAFGNTRVRIVSNDTDFFRQMGVDVTPATRHFEEIRPGRWFIPNCVDTEIFRRVEPIPDLAALHPIIVPRSIVPRRGLHLAVESFARFWPAHREFHLVITGGYEDAAYRRSLDARVEQLGLTDQVIFWGHVPWQEMPGVFSSARMTLIPSIFGEGTSIAALESMACGTATLGTRVGGLVDLPSHNVEPAVESLAAALSEVHDHCGAIAERQARRVRETFNLDRWRDAWLRTVHWN